MPAYSVIAYERSSACFRFASALVSMCFCILIVDLGLLSIVTLWQPITSPHWWTGGVWILPSVHIVLINGDCRSMRYYSYQFTAVCDFRVACDFCTCCLLELLLPTHKASQYIVFIVIRALPLGSIYVAVSLLSACQPGSKCVNTEL